MQRANTPPLPLPPVQVTQDVFEDQKDYDKVTGIMAAGVGVLAGFVAVSAGSCFALPIVGMAAGLFAIHTVCHKSLCERNISVIPTWLKKGVKVLKDVPSYITPATAPNNTTSDNDAMRMLVKGALISCIVTPIALLTGNTQAALFANAFIASGTGLTALYRLCTKGRIHGSS
ncbi:hypothetical protein [Sansalvadorimonas verongulae]|uniref:hypothetical protein n=1 Tax=Sansalvadorimonas verongulae TaxID=2172824 RepID=UPI0012BC0526|nr:hypothetical protein [Sansalvadorimonas verongulae]MTI12829.1 hypothetical protein [Sansalvadorimonas verongulae]